MNENRHTEEVKAALRLLNIPDESLNQECLSDLHCSIEKKFTKLGEYSYPLWENMQTDKLYGSIQNANAWQSLSELFADEKMYLFFEKSEDENIFLIDGNVISALLAECYFFTFYLTNQNFDFLLAFNEHEFVIAVGEFNEKLSVFYTKYTFHKSN